MPTLSFMRFNGTPGLTLWGMRALVGVALFAAAASERLLLVAGIVACIVALITWEAWKLRQRRRSD